MKVQITSQPQPLPPPPPSEVQIILDRDSAERLRAVVGRVSGEHPFAIEMFQGLGDALYGYKYSTQNKYKVVFDANQNLTFKETLK